jgi:hypothetical protein
MPTLTLLAHRCDWTNLLHRRAGQANRSTTRPTVTVSASPSSGSARLERSRSTPQERSVSLSPRQSVVMVTQCGRVRMLGVGAARMCLLDRSRCHRVHLPASVCGSMRTRSSFHTRSSHDSMAMPTRKSILTHSTCSSYTSQARRAGPKRTRHACK